MTEEQQRTPWAQSASGAIIINGVIAAVVGAVTGWALNNASKIPWDRVVYVGVGVAIGMFLVLTFVRKRLREAIWTRPARWLWSWRPVSARRHDRVTAELVRNLVAANLARKELGIKADEALNEIRGSIPDVALVLSEQLADEKQRVDTIMNAVEDLSKTQKELQGKQQKLEAMIIARGPQTSAGAGAQQRPAPIPSPAPRWRIIAPSQRDDQNQDDGNYLLKNLIENSVAKNVRLENDGVGYFEFEDGAFWPDMSGRRTGAFAGQIVDVDEVGDVRLRLTYLDADGRSEVIRYWVSRDGRVREIHQEVNPWGDETPF